MLVLLNQHAIAIEVEDVKSHTQVSCMRSNRTTGGQSAALAHAVLGGVPVAMACASGGNFNGPGANRMLQATGMPS